MNPYQDMNRLRKATDLASTFYDHSAAEAGKIGQWIRELHAASPDDGWFAEVETQARVSHASGDTWLLVADLLEQRARHAAWRSALPSERAQWASEVPPLPADPFTLLP